MKHYSRRKRRQIEILYRQKLMRPFQPRLDRVKRRETPRIIPAGLHNEDVLPGVNDLDERDCMISRILTPSTRRKIADDPPFAALDVDGLDDDQPIVRVKGSVDLRSLHVFVRKLHNRMVGQELH